MLKKRVIPVQLLMGGRLVKTRRFAEPRDVGDPVKSSAVYNSQYADELIFLNVERGARSVAPLASVIERVSEVCFMPLAVGGGIRSFEDAEFLIRNGADKVVLSSVVFDRPDTVTRVAERFGAQAVVVCVDVRREGGAGRPVVHADCGRDPRPVPFEEHVARCVALGAGEILVQSIDRDGTMEGFDIPLVRDAARAASVPVIACGGSGNYEHLREVFAETGASAVACGSLFNFSDSNPMRAKAYLTNHGFAFKVV